MTSLPFLVLTCNVVAPSPVAAEATRPAAPIQIHFDRMLLLSLEMTSPAIPANAARG
jgi:hypothetical protein